MRGDGTERLSALRMGGRGARPHGVSPLKLGGALMERVVRSGEM